MKNDLPKLLVVILAPFLMATQCEDDFDNSGFETTYFIQNNTGDNLFLLNEQDAFVEIVDDSNISIGSVLNSETEPIEPSESFIFGTVRLYKAENGNFILVYEQDPLDDTLWELNEPTENRFEYTLVITSDLLD